MEPSAANVEQQIQAQIEELRGKFPQTQELYREACIVLFFRHGITPTANKLYQYVRKGSMSAPAEALTKFWSDLRDKSRARIEHPDLPEEVKGAAGELAASLWTQAQQLAHASLAGLRAEAHAQVSDAKAAEEGAKQRAELTSRELAEAKQLLATARERIRSVEQALAAETAIRIAGQQQLDAARVADAVAQRAIEEARREFAAELEKLRTTAHLSAERYEAAERRALLEIDRERTAAVRLQKELEAVRDASDATAHRHRSETDALQTQIGDLRQHNGLLDGNLQAMTATQDRLTADLAEVQRRLESAQTQVATIAADRDNWQGRATEALQAIAELQRELETRQKTKPANTNTASRAGKARRST